MELQRIRHEWSDWACRRGWNVGDIYSGYFSAVSVSLNAFSSSSRFAVILPVPPVQKWPSFSLFSFLRSHCSGARALMAQYFKAYPPQVSLSWMVTASHMWPRAPETWPLWCELGREYKMRLGMSKGSLRQRMYSSLLVIMLIPCWNDKF